MNWFWQKEKCDKEAASLEKQTAALRAELRAEREKLRMELLKETVGQDDG